MTLQVPADKIIDFKLTLAEARVILEWLAHAPWHIAQPIIQKMDEQAEEQIKPPKKPRNKKSFTKNKKPDK